MGGGRVGGGLDVSDVSGLVQKEGQNEVHNISPLDHPCSSTTQRRGSE